MEIRKLQLSGGSTFVISLPKPWIDRNRLARGSPVALHEEGDGTMLLIPRADAPSERRVVEVRIPEGSPEKHTVRRLIGAYLSGADEIRIVGGERGPLRDTVRRLVRNLVGVEIVEEAADALVLQDLIGTAEMDLRKSLTRMHVIALQMYADAMNGLAAAGDDVAQVVARDDELDRLAWLVSKQVHALLEQPRLAARLNAQPIEALDYLLATRILERMGDHAAKIARNVHALGGARPSPAVQDALRRQAQAVRAVWEAAFRCLKTAELEPALQAADEADHVLTWRAGFAKLLEHEPAALAGHLVLVGDSLDRLAGYARDIAEVAMNHSFRPRNA